MAKNIQDYKKAFEAIYNEMIADYGVDKAHVAISWVLDRENGEWIYKPNVLITL